MIRVHRGADAGRVRLASIIRPGPPFGLFRNEGGVDAATVDADRKVVPDVKLLPATTCRTQIFSGNIRSGENRFDRPAGQFKIGPGPIDFHWKLTQGALPWAGKNMFFE